jgi:hypothetical protein
MSKTLKRTLAVVMAVAMIFSLSATAFATSGATVICAYEGTPFLYESVNITQNMTAKDAFDLFAEDLELEWKTVPNLNPHYGNLAFVVDSIYGTGSEPLGADSGITAQFWSSTYPGYGIEYVDYTTTPGTPIYHYIYVGCDWKFTVNGNTPVDPLYSSFELYADQYILQDGDVISIDYVEQVTRWTDTTYWLNS